jgi:serine/threonine protein kinase
MTLKQGTRLGPYEVVAPLGSGGMGEVYRARDARLGRDVALKVLPEAFARDAERMARFEREARVLASLNHPNIASLYGVEESGGTRALVMELVEGPTLAERIRQEPLPADEALLVARQIAEGLEYAHERSIVHRDLKPPNVKLAPDGPVKILDFGLAKALEEEATEEELQNSPTLIAAATRTGALLGTAAYMSPEQARGRRVDRRADIWAFGCVLWEMLTGRGPFSGETTSDTLAAVIRAEPDWSALSQSAPPPIRELLRRCLQKDPRQRLQAIGDARIVIEEALSGALPDASLSVPAPVPAVSAAPRPRTLPWAISGALAVTLAIALVAGYPNRAPDSPAPLRASLLPPKDSRIRPYEFALSPDGRKIAFVSYGPARDEDTIWVRSLGSTSARLLEGTENASYPFWSPDSKSIGFFTGDTLKRVDASGGPVTTLAAASAARGGAWGRNGNIVFAADLGARGLSEVSSAGGPVSSLGDFDPSGAHWSHRWPSFLPDGRHVLFFAIARVGATGGTRADDAAGVYVLDLKTKEQRRLLGADSQAESSSGYLLFVREGNLMAQPFDETSVALSGEARPVADGVKYSQDFERGAFSVSVEGLLAYGGDTGGLSVLQWFTRDGKEAGRVGAPAHFSTVSLSPDGTRAATSIGEGPGPRRDIWVYDTARGTSTRLTMEAVEANYPVWNNGGSKIFYCDSGPRGAGIYSVSSSGLGGSEFVSLQGDCAPNGVSPDGRSLVYMNFLAGSPLLWIHPFARGDKDYLLPLSKQTSGEGQFSPDGHWLAYSSGESGRPEVNIASFPGMSSRLQVSTAGGSQARWRGDGRELYYIAPNANLMAVPITISDGSIRAGVPRVLFATSIVAVAYDFQQYDVTADGRRFLINSQLDEAQPITIYENWEPALRTR